jgi:hypothetical protein
MELDFTIDKKRQVSKTRLHCNFEERATTLQDSDLNDPLVISHLEKHIPFRSVFSCLVIT